MQRYRTFALESRSADERHEADIECALGSASTPDRCRWSERHSSAIGDSTQSGSRIAWTKS